MTVPTLYRFLIRLSSDLTIKSDQVRAKFLGILYRNIHNRLSAPEFKGTSRVEKRWSRIYVEAEDPTVRTALSQIFGVHGVQEILADVPASWDDLITSALKQYSAMIAGKSFVVRVRRTGVHPFTSEQLEQAVGAALLAQALEREGEAAGAPGAPSHGHAPTRVSLRAPEVTVSIEVRGDRGLLLGAETPGPRGLPIGVGGRALALVSGGFDSMVAAWLAHKRGLELDFITFNLAGPGAEGPLLALLSDFCHRWSTGSRSRLVVVDFSAVVTELRRTVKPSLGQVILKRLFYRAAHAYGASLGIQTLITGENIGQVSSQTLQNLYTTEAVFDELPKIPLFQAPPGAKAFSGCARPMVLRPLIMAEKHDIIALSRQIGIYEGASKIPEYCQIFKDRPSTQVAPQWAASGETGFDFGVLAQSLSQATTVALKSLAAEAIHKWSTQQNSGLRVSEWQAYDVLVDLRSEDLYLKDHLPNAINLAPYRLELALQPAGTAGNEGSACDPSGYLLDPMKSYLLYCEHGLHSALLAQSLRQKGFKAFSLKNGFSAAIKST